MNEFEVETHKLSEDFFELLEGKVIEEHINKIKKRKKSQLRFLKSCLI